MISARSLTLILACAIAVPAAQTRAADGAAGLKKLFNLGGKNTPPAVDAARQQFDVLRSIDPKDSRINYAYGVVLVNQHQYADAIPHLSRYLESQPEDFGAVRVKIWAQLQLKQYAEVLDTGTAIGRRFPKPSAAQPQAEWVEVAEFLGTVFGYLEVVRPAAVDAKKAAARKHELVSRLGDTYLPAFDRGREAVVARLAELENERDAKHRQAVSAIEAGKEQANELLKENREKAAAESDAAQTSREQLKDAQRELSLIRGQLTSLNRDRTRLSAQIVTAQAQLANLQPPPTTTNKSVVNNRPGPPRPGDVLNRTFTSTTSRIEFDRYVQAAALANALAQLSKQAFDVDRRILELLTRAAELGDTSAKEALARAESEAQAAKAAKKAKQLERKLASTKAPPAPRGGPPVGRMAMFSTYVPFPYEEETRRVLGWFER
jgi:hypothetical protein